MRAIVALFVLYVGLAAILLWEPTEPAHRQLADASVVARRAAMPQHHATVVGEQPRIARTFSPPTPLTAARRPVVEPRPAATAGVGRSAAVTAPATPERPKPLLQTALSVVIYDASAVPNATPSPLSRSHIPARYTVAATLPSPLLVSPGVDRTGPVRAPAETTFRFEGGEAAHLQRELKRVGCYLGEIDGIWGPGSRRAMTAFIERVNAVLPVEQPDAILLRLVRAHAGAVCGQDCPRGQGMTADGRCMPHAILAQSARRGRIVSGYPRIETAAGPPPARSTHTIRAAAAQGSAYQPASSTARLATFSRPASPGSAHADRSLVPTSAITTAPTSTIGPRSQPPFPGRMAIGGPSAGPPGIARRNSSSDALQPPAPSAQERRARQARATPRSQQVTPRRSSYGATSRSTRWTATFFGSNP